MRSFFGNLLLIVCLLFGATACGPELEPLSGEDYGNILNSPGGLTLNEEKHTAGWGKSDCSICHNFNNIHLVDRTGLSIDMAAIRNTVFTDGLTSCATCHGTNGVE